MAISPYLTRATNRRSQWLRILPPQRPRRFRAHRHRRFTLRSTAIRRTRKCARATPCWDTRPCVWTGRATKAIRRDRTALRFISPTTKTRRPRSRARRSSTTLISTVCPRGQPARRLSRHVRGRARLRAPHRDRANRHNGHRPGTAASTTGRARGHTALAGQG